MAGSWKKSILLVLTVSCTVFAQVGTASASATGVEVPNQRPNGVQPGTAATAAVPLPPPVSQGLNPGSGSPSAQGGAPPTAPGAPKTGSPPAGPPGAPGAPGHPQAAAGPPGGGIPPGMEKPKTPYIYAPSFTMAVVGAVAYVILSIITTKQAIKYKTWYLLLVPQATMVGAVGMIARTHNILNLKESLTPTTPFIVQLMTINALPALVGIMNIMTFTRVVWWITPDNKRNTKTLKTPPHFISLLWAGFAVIPDIVKAIVGLMSKPKHGEKPNPNSMANRIQAIALIVHFFAFFCWVLWALRFMIKSRKWMMSGEVIERRGRRLGWACIVMGFLICIRTTWSVVEFDAQSTPFGFVSQHEWTYWFGNHLPMILIYIIFILHQPGKYLPREYTRFKFEPKQIEKLKLETACLRRDISSPVVANDSKTYEITTTEVIHPGSRV